ncbi:host attachment protein [Mesorhizobium huakuii]|uniref:host attachment protein n=1 Tax=Mesorhizobium huakuii TaxID=28104 RepID=UPI0024E179BD|nr:host attachment protein [Mesorhizobium huakuii]
MINNESLGHAMIMMAGFRTRLSMRRQRIWVLVADGARARILRDVLSAGEPSGDGDDLVFKAQRRQLREIMADKPGRSFASVGTRRSAMEYHSEPVREEDRAFASTLADTLQNHHLAKDFDRLVVVAAPQMLGDLRQAFPESLRKVIAAEIAKDFTKLSALELRDAIRKLEINRLSTSE